MKKTPKTSINGLFEIFGSRAKSQEIILLLEGVKPVVRHGFYLNELSKVLNFCNKNKLYIVRSGFAVDVADKEKRFSNKGKVSENNKGMFFTYISKDKKLAQAAAAAEQKQDHSSLGKLLGYPQCCINYFIKNFSETHTDLEQPSHNPLTNLSLRHKDYVILSHFPCSPDCKSSISLAKNYLKILKDHDPKYVKELLKHV